MGRGYGVAGRRIKILVKFSALYKLQEDSSSKVKNRRMMIMIIITIPEPRPVPPKPPKPIRIPSSQH
jgi:hypothetical protein